MNEISYAEIFDEVIRMQSKKMIHVDSKLKVRYTFLYGFMLKFYVMICFYRGKIVIL